MFEVRVEADFAAAHFLRDYHGKCENLHGHNYKVYAHVKGNSLSEGGMLLDFTILKGALKKVCGILDHTNLNDNSFFDQNPSAERIALFIYQNILEEMKSQKEDYSFTGDKNRPHLYSVDVFETDTSRATYSVY